MRILIYKIPLLNANSKGPNVTNKSLDYCVLLDANVEIINYNYKIGLPRTTIIMNEWKKVLENEFMINDKPIKGFEILTNDKGLLDEVNNLKFRSKTVSAGLIERHELLNELMSKTPLIFDKDSISDGLNLIEIKNLVKNYVNASPGIMLNRLKKLDESISVLKPIDSFAKEPVFLKLDKGLRFVGKTQDIEFVKKHLLIKHYEKDMQLKFNNYGDASLYSLGELGLITNELISIWM